MEAVVCLWGLLRGFRWVGGDLMAFLSIVICDLRCLIGLCDGMFYICLDLKLRYYIAVAVGFALTCENAGSWTAI